MLGWPTSLIILRKNNILNKLISDFIFIQNKLFVFCTKKMDWKPVKKDCLYLVTPSVALGPHNAMVG